MKRLLLWFAVMFALGEVTYMFAGKVITISIIFIMLICCAKKYVSISIPEKILLTLCFVLGVLNVHRINTTLLKAEKEYYISGSSIIVDKKEGDFGFTYTVEFVDTVFCDGEEYKVGKVIIYGVEEVYSIGDLCQVQGTLETFEQARNPGSFDMKMYYRSNGINFYMNNVKIYNSEKSNKNGFKNMFYAYKNKLYDWREDLLAKMRAYISEEFVGVFESILLGEKSNLKSDVRMLYRINGIAHILAISGLHVTLVGGMIYKLLRQIGFRFVLSGGISIGIVLSYGLMTGNSNSTMRAVIMIVISLVGEILGRNYDMLTGMGVAIIFMLIANPYKIYDGGAILSFLAVVGVALGQYVSKKIFCLKKLKRLKKKRLYIYSFINSIIITISINIITFPVIINLYYEFPLYSVVINLIVIPLVTLVVILGILSLVMSCINLEMARFMIYPGEKILQFYEWLCNVFLEFPYSTVNVGVISTTEVVLYYLCVLTVFVLSVEKIKKYLKEKIYKRTRRWFDKREWATLLIVINLFLVGLFGFGIALTHVQNKREIICFLDVGQGDGILIRTKNGTNMVIDGGSSSNDELGEYVLMPAIKYMAMSNIDYWFVTHADHDHISGLEYILEEGKKTGIKINNLVVSKNIYRDEELENLLALAVNENINIIYFDYCEQITDGEFAISCCFPYKEFEIEDKNQGSMALSYVSSDLKILFTGDMDSKACEAMLEQENNVLESQYDVLKVPHHGSKYSVCESLYSRVSGYGVISCGEDNIYGHPHQETLRELEDSNCRILMTKNEGAIFILSPFQSSSFLIY